MDDSTTSPRLLARPERYHVCRYCGSDVIHQDDGYYFLCPVHGDIPPADVATISAQQHQEQEAARRMR